MKITDDDASGNEWKNTNAISTFNDIKSFKDNFVGRLHAQVLARQSMQLIRLKTEGILTEGP